MHRQLCNRETLGRLGEWRGAVTLGLRMCCFTTGYSRDPAKSSHQTDRKEYYSTVRNAARFSTPSVERWCNGRTAFGPPMSRVSGTRLDALSSKERNKFRRGLRDCEVRRISVKELADEGYQVYCAAWEHYGGQIPVTNEHLFQQGVLREAPYPDLLHNWGVYVNGRLIAYAQNQIHGKVEVSYSSIKLDPAYLHLRPSYALIHKMNEYYLDSLGFEYVNDGSRSIHHETNIQEFLMHNFCFEKAYTTLYVYYRWPLRWLLKIVYPFRDYVGQADSRLKALLELERFRRASRFSVSDAQ